MIKKSILLASTYAVIAGTLVGCMDTVNSQENKDKHGVVKSIETTKVTTDGFLRRRLAITQIIERTSPRTGLLEIQVTAVSRRTGIIDWALQGDHPYKVEYRFEWLDESGFAAETATSTWLERDITPGDTTYFKAVAPNERCKDFVLKLKESRNDPHGF
jgi:uncharacterized protein YcfL